MQNTTEINNFPEFIRLSGGSEDQNGYLHFPESIGRGYLKIVKPFPQLSIMLQHYELKESFIIKRNKQIGKKNTLTFSFRNVIFDPQYNIQNSSFRFLPSVQISTSDMELDIEVSNAVKTSNIIIGVEVDFLQLLLEKDENRRIKELISQKEQSYLYEEFVSPPIQVIAKEIFQISTNHQLANFYYKIKAEEMICLLFENLLKREEFQNYPINRKDVKIIYALREELLNHIDTPPKLEELANKANMSVSKMGKIFKQIFGDSIYNYYQKLRMQKAVFLLREQQLSVSETGYQLGFSNLSHFTRLFEKHIGLKPKKYSKKKDS